MDKNYLLLGQLYENIRSSSIEDSIDDIRVFLETSGYDVNYQIPHDSLFAKREPQYLGYTALHFAVYYKRPDLIELLLSYRPDVTCIAGNGDTPLILAMKKINIHNLFFGQCKNRKIFDLLLLAQKKSNNVTNPSCNDGISHFHIACLADNVPVARLFLQAGVSVNQKIKDTSRLFPGWSPLRFAVKFGTEELVKLLMTHGADLNLIGSGLTPLCLLVEQSVKINDYVVYRDHIYGETEVESELLRIDTLIDLFINKDCLKNVIDDIGLSFFHVSCTKNDTNLVEKFLELRADVNLKVNADSPLWAAYTPLHFAAHCNPEIFKLLVEKGADILAKDAKGVTPLDLFVQKYKPAQVCDVLNLHQTFGHIQFDNGVKLVDAISAMEHENDFSQFTRDTNVNTCLPGSSPLWPGYSLIHLAVLLSTRYNKALITICLQFKANLTMQDAKGMTPLHLAFHLSKENIVKELLQKIASSNVTENCIDGNGLSHLQIACFSDNVTLVRKFLEYGFDPSSPTRNDIIWCNVIRKNKSSRAGSTLYHIAPMNFSESMIELISKTGAKADLLDDDGLTAIHLCFLNCRSPPMIKTLLSLPENRKTNYTAVKAGGLSHLHVACSSYECDEGKYYDLDSVKELASVATDIDAQINCGTVIDLYAEELAEYDGWTPLHFAVNSGFIEAVDVLISKGADIRAKNAAGRNSLHLALQYCENYYRSNVIETLYLELKKEKEWRDEYGLTRLHVACVLAGKDEIENLLNAGEDLNRKIVANSPIWPGNSPLHVFIKYRFFGDEIEAMKILLLLLKHGADMTIKNTDDCSPLHLIWDTQKYFNIQYIADVMMETGPRFCNANPSNRHGLSHFHLSCLFGDVEIVKNFIDSGVNVNKPVCPFAYEYAGFTPLHFALHYKNTEVVELLLQCGADVKSEDSRGLTPIQEAILRCPTMLPVLLSNGQVDLQAEIIVFKKKTLSLILSKDYEWSNFQILLDKGFSINFFDPPMKEKNVALFAWKMNYDIFRALVEGATDVTNVDANGKNIVHNIGSLHIRSSNDQEVACCALNVNLWLDKACNLNLQDKLGRTPLHDATITGGDAVRVLLLLGADVNIRDNQGRTAFSYINDNDYDAKSSFLNHILMISCCGFHLEDSLDEIVKRKYGDESKERRDCNSELARIANFSITEDMSLRDLLREQMVGNFPHFNVEKRNVILDFLRPECLFKGYGELRDDWITDLFQLQYRKILRRTELLEPAKMSFYEHIYQLDLPCIESIIRNLSNYDLENLIKV